jgi:quinol monooxygenase YgiN
MAAAMIFTFDVPEEKQADYLKATIEKIKPFWESHGCYSYDIWQTTDGEPEFMKIMLFSDVDAIKKSTQGNEEAKPVVQLYNSFAINISTKTYVKKT